MAGRWPIPARLFEGLTGIRDDFDGLQRRIALTQTAIRWVLLVEFRRVSLGLGWLLSFLSIGYVMYLAAEYWTGLMRSGMRALFIIGFPVFAIWLGEGYEAEYGRRHSTAASQCSSRDQTVYVAGARIGRASWQILMKSGEEDAA